MSKNKNIFLKDIIRKKYVIPVFVFSLGIQFRNKLWLVTGCGSVSGLDPNPGARQL
jgi:hypothetical protein